jgi:V-type H+-transporting ATPase subunit D
LDREEFYRLKKVSNKKQRDSAAADAEIVAAREREAADREAADKRAAEVETVPEAPDVLGENEDADVIF